MLKKIIAATIFVAIALVATKLIFKNQTQLTQPENNLPKVTPVAKNEFNASEYETNNLQIYFIKTNSKNIFLISNLEDKLSAKDAKIKYSCNWLTSAGFYTTEGNPVGLLKIDNKVIGTKKSNDTFNSYYSKYTDGTSMIGYKAPTKEVNFSLQTGPMLINDHIPIKLDINNDKPARRVVVAMDSNNSSYFIVVYSPSSVYSGPMLSDLPLIIEMLGKDKNLDIKNATNLDGGTASAFLADNAKLNELSPVGSFFCIK